MLRVLGTGVAEEGRGTDGVLETRDTVKVSTILFFAKRTFVVNVWFRFESSDSDGTSKSIALISWIEGLIKYQLTAQTMTL